MPIIIIIEKENIKELKIDDISDLYKKCKFKKIDGFNEIHEWEINEKKIKLMGKCSGKNNSKNPYIFPNVSTIIYGSCALVCLENNKYTDLYINEWNNFLKDNTFVECSINLKDNIVLKKEKEKEKDEQSILNEKLSKNDIDSDEEKEDKEDKEKDYDNDNDNDELDDTELSCDEDNYDKETSDIELEEDKEINELNDDEKYFSGSELSADVYIYSSEED